MPTESSAPYADNADGVTFGILNNARAVLAKYPEKEGE